MTPEAGHSQRLEPLAPALSRLSAWDWVLLTCAVAVAAPLWVGRYLPFADLPEHVAMIATLRHWWDQAWVAQHAFTLAFRNTQYLLYYVVGALLSVVFGTAERANLVVLTAVAVGLPYSLRSFLRAAGRDERLAILGCPFIWSMPLLIGLLNYVAALPLVIWGLAQAIRQAERPTLGRGAGLALIGVLIFYLHLSALLFFLPASLLCFIFWPTPQATKGIARLLAERASVLWRKLAWMIPAAALCLDWLLTSPVVRPGSIGWTETVEVEFQAPQVALAQLPEALLDIWRGNASRWPIVVWLAALALIAWPTRQRRLDWVARWQKAGMGSIVSLAMVLYFSMPFVIGWLWWINARYAILAALLLPALAPAPRGTRGLLSLSLGAAIALWVATTAAVHVRAFQREATGFEPVLAHARPGRRLFSMIFEQRSDVARFIPYHHFGSYYRARFGGIAEPSFANLPQSPVRYRPEITPPPRAPDWEWDPTTFRNELDGEYYDYVLVRGKVDLFAPKPPGPTWRLAAREGRWALFEKATAPTW